MIDAHLRMTVYIQPLTFVGLLAVYCDMLPNWTHVVAPLTACSDMKKNTLLTWTVTIQQTFDKRLQSLAANALSANPNHNKQFDVYTDAS